MIKNNCAAEKNIFLKINNLIMDAVSNTEQFVETFYGINGIISETQGLTFPYNFCALTP